MDQGRDLYGEGVKSREQRRRELASRSVGCRDRGETKKWLAVFCEEPSLE